ncbi:MAG: hypothetical protein GY822_17030 [Deltaproteobacteria bacterium]|nr:hypothetical protein [Deltaproteobacteria bacterium]
MKSSKAHQTRHLLSDDRCQYERQPQESDPSWGAFQAYRNQGVSRSHAKVAQELGKSVSLMGRWSTQWRWRERVLAWDEHVDTEQRNAVINDAKAMRTRHLGLAMDMQNAGSQMLNKLLAALDRGDERNITISEARQLIDVGSKIERLNRAEQIADQERTKPVKDMRDDDKRAHAKLAQILGIELDEDGNVIDDED